MQDIQGRTDHRRIAIRKVGVKNISYPVTVLDRARRRQHTVASFNMYVNLPHHFKGTHMSRFVEILNCFHGEIRLDSVRCILHEMKERLQAQSAHLEIEFPYFFIAGKPAEIAVSRHRHPCDDASSDLVKTVADSAVGMMAYTCRLHGMLAEQAEELSLAVSIPIDSPRPGFIGPGLPRSLGHWGLAEISLSFRRFVWIEEIIELALAVTRHHLSWPQPDPGETMTDKAEQGLSVELMARRLAEALARHPDIGSYTVRVENFASGFKTFAAISSG